MPKKLILKLSGNNPNFQLRVFEYTEENLLSFDTNHSNKIGRKLIGLSE